MIEHDRLMPELIEIARAAGAVTLKHYGNVEARQKDDRSPVTAADEEAEALILERLAKLTPDVPVVAEEAAAAGKIPDVGDLPFWLVDPLDGTKEFIHARGEFTVNIGLVEARRPTMGVVLAPAMDAIWWGAVGHGANKRDKEGSRAIEALTVRGRGQATAVASRSHRDEATNAWLEDKGITETVSAGSSLKFCLVAEGAADWYPRFGPTMEWDTGAGHAVLRAAGGEVEALDGGPFLYVKPEFRNPGFIARGRLIG